MEMLAPEREELKEGLLCHGDDEDLHKELELHPLGDIIMSDSVLDPNDPVWRELDGVSHDELFIRGLRSALDNSAGDDLAVRLMSIRAAIPFGDDPDRLQKIYDAYVGSPELDKKHDDDSGFDMVTILENQIQHSDNSSLWRESCEDYYCLARDLRNTRVNKYLAGDEGCSLNNMADKLDVSSTDLFRFENWNKDNPNFLSSEKIMEYAAWLGYAISFNLYNHD